MGKYDYSIAQRDQQNYTAVNTESAEVNERIPTVKEYHRQMKEYVDIIRIQVEQLAKYIDSDYKYDYGAEAEKKKPADCMMQAIQSEVAMAREAKNILDDIFMLLGVDE